MLLDLNLVIERIAFRLLKIFAWKLLVLNKIITNDEGPIFYHHVFTSKMNFSKQRLK